MRTNVRYLFTIGMAIQLVISAAPSLLTAQAQRMLGEPDTSALALMGVGADDAGAVVAIGGGVIALVGLYRYLR